MDRRQQAGREWVCLGEAAPEEPPRSPLSHLRRATAHGASARLQQVPLLERVLLSVSCVTVSGVSCTEEEGIRRLKARTSRRDVGKKEREPTSSSPFQPFRHSVRGQDLQLRSGQEDAFTLLASTTSLCAPIRSFRYRNVILCGQILDDTLGF